MSISDGALLHLTKQIQLLREELAQAKAERDQARELLNSCKLAMVHVSNSGGYADWKHMIAAIDEERLSHAVNDKPEPMSKFHRKPCDQTNYD